MRALSIRQPYVEQILRGTKTVEYRSRAVRSLVGERFYLYAARPKTAGEIAESKALARMSPATKTGAAASPHAKTGASASPGGRGGLPYGVIVGTAVISHCTGRPGDYQWHLTGVRRLARSRKPARQPQPSWFRPF